MSKKNKVYSMTLRGKYLSTDVDSMEDLLQSYESEIKLLKELNVFVTANEISVDFSGADDDYIEFSTESQALARKFGMT